ncbi:predicted protein [Uncinocarpus reesii 1704]|uniref:Uncharacterized protein n=1 Tax=Uncinocarpus reesii (strain UAMH 1704) TaxID=336963 RepID=C4JT49_UNCRE|nr:uncharacterized protein UREG_05638 [Uncinocarpus reesii 1704]EEP80796.1 predicted protein [Uncinocarpus reesii 1704]
MLPPSDSIGHQNLKLAEFLAGLQNQASLPAPPPPYAAVQTHDDSADFDEEEDDGIPLPPLVLKIDTSITIDGQANTVAIPASGASSEEGQAIPSEPQYMQQLQQQRQAKSVQIASSVMAALKACGILDDRETGRSRPVEINIDAGIHIKGAKNVVCSGLKRRPEAASFQAPALGRPQGSERKRRAQSEPSEPPSRKRLSA